MEEMVGSDWLLTRRLEASPGWAGKSQLGEMALFSSACRSALEKRLTPPTLLEMAIFRQLCDECIG